MSNVFLEGVDLWVLNASEWTLKAARATLVIDAKRNALAVIDDDKLLVAMPTAERVNHIVAAVNFHVYARVRAHRLIVVE